MAAARDLLAMASPVVLEPWPWPPPSSKLGHGHSTCAQSLAMAAARAQRAEAAGIDLKFRSSSPRFFLFLVLCFVAVWLHITDFEVARLISLVDEKIKKRK
ncbi:hypothetical protein NL676_035019 [Syzygium grande]|nr:hypothetical protein NL676_035019 [Syzygium grande]